MASGRKNFVSSINKWHLEHRKGKFKNQNGRNIGNAYLKPQMPSRTQKIIILKHNCYPEHRIPQQRLSRFKHNLSNAQT